MKLLFDHNLSYRLVSALGSLYPNSRHIRELGMATATDDALWNYAREHAMIIVSKDSDFYHYSMLLGHPPKIIWLRLGNCTTGEIRNLLSARHADLLEFDQDPNISFLVLG